MMKIRTSFAVPVLSFMLAALPAALQAQTPLPDDTLRPIAPPGTIGKKGAEGVVPLSRSPAVEATVAAVRSHPRSFEGRNVTIVAELEEIFAPWSMKLDESSATGAGIDADLLVVGQVPLRALGLDASWTGHKVSVTGTVRILQASDFRREYGRGADDKLFRRYEGKPALIATSLKMVE